MHGWILWSVLWVIGNPMGQTQTERMMAQVGTPNHELAAAIDELTDDPKERSLLVAIARFEAGPSFAQNTVGDHGHSRGPYQRLDGPESFLWDAKASTREALRQLRESWNGCRHLPKTDRLAIYARGRCNARGSELSRPRVRMAMMLGGWR
jgi:hypothetical protein